MRSLILCAPLVCVAACSDSDGPDTTIDEKTAERQALGAVEVQDAMLTNTGAIVTGTFDDLGVQWQRLLGLPEDRSAAEPAWDPEEERWVILVGYENGQSSLAYVFTIQYTNTDGTHPMSPAAETTLAAYGLEADMRSRTYGNGDSIHADLHYGCGMDITQLSAPSYSVLGRGTTTGLLEGNQNGREIEYALAMDWELDAAVPRDGRCGTGTVTVALHTYDLVAVYEPDTGSYAWEFSRWGSPISSGHGSAACGKSPNPVTQPAPPPRD